MGATKGWKVKYDYEKQLEELMKFISNDVIGYTQTIILSKRCEGRPHV